MPETNGRNLLYSYSQILNRMKDSELQLPAPSQVDMWLRRGIVQPERHTRQQRCPGNQNWYWSVDKRQYNREQHPVSQTSVYHRKWKRERVIPAHILSISAILFFPENSKQKREKLHTPSSSQSRRPRLRGGQIPTRWSLEASGSLENSISMHWFPQN